MRRHAHDIRIRAVRLVARLGHLAVWTGLYVTGAVVWLALLAGLDRFGARPGDRLAMLCALATGTSVYLVDRAKLCDRQFDPADREAHPARFRVVWPLRRRLRTAAAVSAVIGLIAAGALHPLLALVVVGAHAGLLAYSGLPPDPTRPPRRVKDVLIAKNLAVAGSIAAFGVVLLVGARPEALATSWAATLERLWLPALLTGLLVMADAVLCDLDDVPSDRRFGTRTIPGRLAPGPVWALSVGAHVLAGALAVAALGTRPEVLVLGAGLPLTTLLLALLRPARVRDLVDARLPLLAALGLAASHPTAAPLA